MISLSHPRAAASRLHSARSSPSQALKHSAISRAGSQSQHVSHRQPLAPVSRHSSVSDGAESRSRCDDYDRRAVLATGLALSTKFGLDLWAPESAKAEEEYFLEENPIQLGNGFQKFYGQATSASSYGGYGGTDSKALSSFKYYYDIPTTWGPMTVNKQDKGYNGVDSRWAQNVNEKTPAKRAYLVTLAGYAKLKPDKEEILDDLSLADPKLQDALFGAEEVNYEEILLGPEDQLYVDYIIKGEDRTVLSRVTAYGGRLYSFFVWGTESDFKREGQKLYQIRDSFRTLVRDPEQVRLDLEYFKRAT